MSMFRTLLMQKKGGGIPSGYTQLEYVTSGISGYNGYLNTGVVPQIDDTIKINVYRRGTYPFWGADNFVTALNGVYDYWRVFNTAGVNKGVWANNIWNEYTYQARTLVDSVKGYQQASAGNACQQPMFLFRRQSSASVCNCDISYFLIEGKIELIPASRDSDGVVGFYDLVNRTFVPPTSGTFKAGPIV